MISLKAKKRKQKDLKGLRAKEKVPAVLYGSNVKNTNLEVDLKEFNKVYKEAGESSLISLEVKDEKEKFLVLIRDIQFNVITDNPIHIDFYQPNLKEEVEIMIPLIFEGEAPVIKSLGGTLVKNISEIEVKAFPQDLPKEIKIDISKLKTFDDNILVKDLQILSGIKILKDPDEIIVTVSAPEKVEEELEKPIEEKETEVISKERESEEKGVKEEEKPVSAEVLTGQEKKKEKK
ncbi:MAG: 50S ribosomal protein L25 [Patescibacteria group bacterium]|nr:50S ribosomal protein L25 [Patescibacteria group bacterium]